MSGFKGHRQRWRLGEIPPDAYSLFDNFTQGATFCRRVGESDQAFAERLGCVFVPHRVRFRGRYVS